MSFQSKRKGSRLEREWAELLRGYDLDKNAKRMPLSGGFSDERFKSDIVTVLPYHFEIKNQEVWKPLEYYRQAELTAGGKMPVVVMSRNREQIYVFLLGSDFLNLIKQVKDTGLLIKPRIPKPTKLKKTDMTEGLPFAKSKFTHHNQENGKRDRFKRQAPGTAKAPNQNVIPGGS